MSKRTERSSSSSSTDSAVYQEEKLRKVEILEMTTERDELTMEKIHSALELLTTHVDNRFAELSNEMSTFRLEIQAVVDRRNYSRDFHFPLRIKAKISEYAPILTFSNYA